MELLSVLCGLLLGGATVHLKTSTGQQLSHFTRLFPDFQQALEKDWASLLDDAWHTTGSWGRSNSNGASWSSSRLGILKSNSTSGDGRWLGTFLGRSPSSFYGLLWMSLRHWKASSGGACLPSFLCAILLHIKSQVPSVGFPLVQLTVGGSKVPVLWFVSGLGIV